MNNTDRVSQCITAVVNIFLQDPWVLSSNLGASMNIRLEKRPQSIFLQREENSQPYRLNIIVIA
jgi:hypothetical protein